MPDEDKNQGDKIDALLASDEVNEPQKLPAKGCTGPRDVISPDMQRKRREALSNLLAGGRSDDEIYAVMCRPEFGVMTEGAVNKLMVEVFEQWASSDRQRSPFKRHAAEHRLLRHIAKAREEKQWAAVAQLEKTLMLIQGTAAETRVHLDTHTSVDVRVNEAAARVLKDYPQEQLKALLGEGIKRIEGETVTIDND